MKKAQTVCKIIIPLNRNVGSLNLLELMAHVYASRVEAELKAETRICNSR